MTPLAKLLILIPPCCQSVTTRCEGRSWCDDRDETSLVQLRNTVLLRSSRPAQEDTSGHKTGKDADELFRDASQDVSAKWEAFTRKVAAITADGSKGMPDDFVEALANGEKPFDGPDGPIPQGTQNKITSEWQTFITKVGENPFQDAVSQKVADIKRQFGADDADESQYSSLIQESIAKMEGPKDETSDGKKSADTKSDDKAEKSVQSILKDAKKKLLAVWKTFSKKVEDIKAAAKKKMPESLETEFENRLKPAQEPDQPFMQDARKKIAAEAKVMHKQAAAIKEEAKKKCVSVSGHGCWHKAEARGLEQMHARLGEVLGLPVLLQEQSKLSWYPGGEGEYYGGEDEYYGNPGEAAYSAAYTAKGAEDENAYLLSKSMERNAARHMYENQDRAWGQVASNDVLSHGAGANAWAMRKAAGAKAMVKAAYWRNDAMKKAAARKGFAEAEAVKKQQRVTAYSEQNEIKWRAVADAEAMKDDASKPPFSLAQGSSSASMYPGAGSGAWETAEIDKGSIDKEAYYFANAAKRRAERASYEDRADAWQKAAGTQVFKHHAIANSLAWRSTSGARAMRNSALVTNDALKKAADWKAYGESEAVNKNAFWEAEAVKKAANGHAYAEAEALKHTARNPIALEQGTGNTSLVPMSAQSA